MEYIYDELKQYTTYKVNNFDNENMANSYLLVYYDIEMPDKIHCVKIITNPKCYYIKNNCISYKDENYSSTCLNELYELYKIEIKIDLTDIILIKKYVLENYNKKNDLKIYECEGYNNYMICENLDKIE